MRTSPEAIDAGEIPLGQNRTWIVEVYSPGKKDFTIKNITTDVPDIDATAESADVSLQFHRVSVIFRAGRALGVHRGTIYIVTDDEKAFLVMIPFTVTVSGPFQCTPSQIEVDKDDIGRIIHRKLLVRSSSPGDTLVARSITTSPPWVLTNLSATKAGDGLATLDFDLMFPSGSGDAMGTLSVELSASEATSFNVPLLIKGWTPSFPEGKSGENRE